MQALQVHYDVILASALVRFVNH